MSNNKIHLYKISLCLMVVYGALLGIASFIEKYNGTEAARELYYHPFVGLLWVLIALAWIISAVQNKLPIRHRSGFYILHLAFLFIITGSLISHYTGVEGSLHIREGEQSSIIYTSQNEAYVLPFSVCLDDFMVIRYPGSNSPQSYKSILTIYEEDACIQTEVYMNKVVSIQKYRLFQTAYDEDELGTFLTVSYDPVGMIVTYIGYALIFIGILLQLCQKKSRMRTLMRKLRLISLFLLIPSSSLFAQPDWSKILVQNPNGRIEPADTYCRALVRKIHHSENVDNMDATTFIVDMISRPEYWNDQPIIYQPNKEIQDRFHYNGKYLRFNDLFDIEGNYLLREDIETIYKTPSHQRDKMQKDLLKLDERLNVILTLEQGKMLPLFPLPGDRMQRWFSPGDDLSEFKGEDSLFVSYIMPWYISEPSQEIVDMIAIYQQKQANCPIPTSNKVNLEQFYNRIRPFHKCAKGYLCFGLLLLMLMFSQVFVSKKKYLTKVSQGVTVLVILFFVLHTVGLAIRWYIGGQAPWSNGYESMVFAAWCILGGSLFFMKRSLMTVSLGAFFSGVILMVSGMNWMNPAITPLVPVLQSPWLMIHVSVIMCGYGFLAMGFLLGTMGMILMTFPKWTQTVRSRLEEIAVINEISLLLGLSLMTAGTFLGAIWANESWGRYWGWDPKETWALITIIVYTIITHARLIPKFNNMYVLNLLSSVGFSSVLMTYLGVNYFMSGMHSYGGGDASFGINVFIIIYILIAILSVVAYLRYKSESHVSGICSSDADIQQS